MGLAGLAKCSTLSTGPLTYMYSVTSWWMNWKRGSRMCSMFSMDPVIRLSIAMTWCPSARKRSQRCEPTNPAPPVIKVVGMRLLSSRLACNGILAGSLGAEPGSLFVDALYFHLGALRAFDYFAHT